MSKIKSTLEDKDKSDNDKIIEIDEILSFKFEEDPNALSQPEKNFVFINNLEREINNGGFHQFFLNSSGNYSLETLEALKAIQANKTVELLTSAMEVFPDSKVSTDRDERSDVIEKIDEQASEVWGGLDTKFYSYEDNISSLLLKYTEDNVNDFTY